MEIGKGSRRMVDAEVSFIREYDSEQRDTNLKKKVTRR